MQDRKLYLEDNSKYYRCGNCNFVARNQNAILGNHTRELHAGMAASIVPIAPRISIGDELEFSQVLPEK